MTPNINFWGGAATFCRLPRNRLYCFIASSKEIVAPPQKLKYEAIFVIFHLHAWVECLNWYKDIDLGNSVINVSSLETYHKTKWINSLFLSKWRWRSVPPSSLFPHQYLLSYSHNRNNKDLIKAATHQLHVSFHQSYLHLLTGEINSREKIFIVKKPAYELCRKLIIQMENKRRCIMNIKKTDKLNSVIHTE